MPRTKRRGYGEGAVFQRADKTWRAIITVGYDSNGKRVRKEVGGQSKAEVQAKLTKLQHEKLDGMLCDTGRLSISQYLQQWVDAVRPSLSDGTLSNYDRVIRLQINPRIGGVQLAKLTPLHVQGVYSAMDRDGHSVEKQRLTHIVLRLALKQAVKWGLVPRNVCDAVEAPRGGKTSEFNVFSKSQVVALLKAAASDRMHAMYVVAVTTGMRLGELFGLKWSNIDLDAGYLQVTQILNEVEGQLKIKEPKTEKSRRRIDLPQMAIDALRKHRDAMTCEGHGSAFVFVNQHGDWWRRSHFHVQSYKPLLKAAELPAIRFHDLRHTSATLLLQDNVHPKVVQERLGHSQISVTLDTYSHVLPTMQKEASGRFDAMFAN